MKKFIGTKVIKAMPMTKANYNDFNNAPCAEEDLERKGYMVGYPDASGNFDGPMDGGCHYISWSPADVFEAAYAPMAGMTFGLAIEAMKAGHKVARTGWNGNGMFIVYQKGYPDGIPCNAQTAKAYGMQEGDLFKCRPYMQLRCVDGSHQMWQPSVSDCLEEDWVIV